MYIEFIIYLFVPCVRNLELRLGKLLLCLNFKVLMALYVGYEFFFLVDKLYFSLSFFKTILSPIRFI